jgi:copper chaperone CopZ
MQGNACRERIAEVLSEVSGVLDVSVSLIRARADVVYRAPCEPGALVAAVVAAGYLAAMDEGKEY